MESDKTIKKITENYLQMESFFVGDFTLKKQKKNIPDVLVSDDPIKSSFESLNSIEEVVKKCRKCEIGNSRQNAVPGYGNPSARLVFVGEAPGADEDEQGLPFVGRAGQLLDKMIIAMGLHRKDVFICNTLKCRPPENRDPKPDELHNCLPYLKKQLEIIQPEVIVALGAHAARILLKTDKPIGQLRGIFHEYIFSENLSPAKLMPTYHPAYLLRNYSNENRKRVWDDLQKVMIELGISRQS